ncbi:conserved hypothetical protein [Gammaproteobacteria bacterium]
MMLTCPCCHASYSLEALTQDEAARELLALRPAMLPSLLPYLTLFRSGKRSLAFDKALALTKETAALCPDPVRLEKALAATVENLRAKREEGQHKPLKNHNYLKKVIEDTPADAVQTTVTATSGHSRRASAIRILTEWAGDDQLRLYLAQLLKALVARSLKGQPAADMIALCADTWHGTIAKQITDDVDDYARLLRASRRLLDQVVEWPQPKHLVNLLPEKSYRPALPRPARTDEQQAAGKEAVRRLANLLDKGAPHE